MTTRTAARAVLTVVTFLANVYGATPAFATDRMHLPVATHQVRPDTQIHANDRGFVPHLAMPLRPDADDPFADIHLE